MTNKETLHHTRNLFAKLLAVLDEANQLPEDAIESLSLFSMRIDFDKIHTGLIDDVYSLESDLHTLQKKGEQQ